MNEPTSVARSPLVRAWQWWIGDSGRAVFVWVGWAVCSVAILNYALRFSVNIPAWEEWLTLPQLLGESDPWPWFVGRLQEHRYVIGRVTLWLVFHTSGGDFRAGCAASAVLTSLAAAVLMRTARKLRGSHHYADLLPVFLLLNPGSCENFFLGYQIAFAWDVLFAALFIRVAADADTRPAHATGSRAAGLLALLSLGGWIGLSFVPPGACWLLWLAWRGGWRSWSAAGLAGAAVALVGYFVWNYWELKQNPLPGEPPQNDPVTMLRVLTEYAALMFGPRGTKFPVTLGWVGVAVFAATVVALGVQAVRAPRRAAAGGALVVVLAVAIMGVALSLRRPSGFAARNIPLLALVGSVAFLWMGRWAWDRSRYHPLRAVPFAGSILVAVGGGVITFYGWAEGLVIGKDHRDRHKAVSHDREMPVRFLASKHYLFPDPLMVERYQSLKRWGHPSMAGVPDDPPCVEGADLPFEPFAGAIPKDPHPPGPRGPQPMWRAVLPQPTHLVGVRLSFRYSRASNQLPIMVLWSRPDGTVGTAVCLPWVISYVWTMDFPINEVATAVWVRTDYDPDPIQPVRLVPLVAP